MALKQSLFGKRHELINKPTNVDCCALICAAGSSRRMGQDKLMMPLKGKTVLQRSIEAFEECSYITGIIVVVRKDMLETMGELCVKSKYKKVIKVVAGGETRLESVSLGLAAAPDEAALIAVHDGARPLVSNRVIAYAVCKAEMFGAAVPAIPVKDTVKTAKKDVAVETLDRSSLMACQTPQVFSRQILSAAISKAMAENAAVTDDAQAVEALGIPVYFTDGDEKNIKITTPLDIVLAEALLEANK